ncbi:MAG: (2Fe-2S)-binding protein [Clostridia bacterium]|nr:(2Fe-2S)-binding protein [Clostridia bacterium]
MNNDKTVCDCMGVTIGDIRAAIENGAKDFDEVQEITGVSSVCGRCRDYAENVVKAILDGE